MRSTHKIFSLFFSGMLLVAAVSVSFGQTTAVKGFVSTKNMVSSPNASVEPVVFNTNIKCSDLNASTDTRFSHIVSDNEFKLNFADPNGTYAFTNTTGTEPDPRVVSGPEYPSKTVTISSSSNPGIVSSWSSTLPITAVVVKVGNTSYVYPYKPFKFGDTDLNTGDARGISHINFCYGDPTGPTAAEVTVSGRVIDASGIGLAKAQIILVNGATGETRITMTSPFGYYSINGLDANELYVLNVNHKFYAFDESQRTIIPSDNMVTSDFIARP